MNALPRLRAFAFAAALLAAPALAGCDSGGSSFNVDTYTGTYTGTATATVTGQPPQSVPFTLNIAKASSSTLTMTFTSNGTAMPVTGTYNSDGATFTSTGTPGYNLRLSAGGKFSGTITFDPNNVATASGSLSRSKLDLTLTATGGTIHYVATR